MTGRVVGTRQALDQHHPSGAKNRTDSPPSSCSLRVGSNRRVCLVCPGVVPRARSFAGQSRQLQVVVVGEEQRRAGRRRRLKHANSSFRYRLMHATALHDALHYPNTASWYVASRALEACSNTRLLGVLLGTRSCSTMPAQLGSSTEAWPKARLPGTSVTASSLYRRSEGSDLHEATSDTFPMPH